MPVQWMVGTNGDDEQVSIKIRALVVDGRVREYVVGPPHQVTERLFVVRRVFRVSLRMRHRNGNGSAVAGCW
jgi:hypothetical protein